ncbi:hypothetical protein M9C81_02695 [SAR86 cluster bacterium]|nr:hypothetical protein M9C81_02695 [SAR86 cluster bacterium]
MQYIEGTIFDLSIFIIMIFLGGLTWFTLNKLLSKVLKNKRMVEVISIVCGLSVGVFVINKFLL